MKTYYQISSDATGKVLLRRRKIAKALRWWLNEHGYDYKYIFYSAYLLAGAWQNVCRYLRFKT
mgnify:CR=1 FL=1